METKRIYRKRGPKPRAATLTDTKKVHLVSYEVKAVIPTGMYANIQPCIVVEAETLEHAERVVMPHIEMLFAKYREGSAPLNVRTVVGKPVVDTKSDIDNVTVEINKPVAVVPETLAQTGPATPVVPAVPTTTATPAAPAEPAIVLSVPFSRASSAVNSCMSLEALQLVADQVEKSEKLVDSEKVELRAMIANKRETFSPIE